MKKEVLFVLALVASITFAGVVTADFRADLAAMNNIDSVWALDTFHTAIWRSKTIGEKEFIDEFLTVCKKYGPIKVQAVRKDALTGQATTEWEPISVNYESNLLGKGAFKYADPVTGKKTHFPSHEESIQYRLDGQFTTTKKFVQMGKYAAPIYGMVFEHPFPQKFTYKIKDLSDADLAKIPPEGDLYRIDPVSKLTGGDLFQYLMALSNAQGGQYSWRITKNGALEETDSFSAYNYLISTLNTPYPAQWFFVHKGAQPFTVKRTIGGGVDELVMFHREPTGQKYRPMTQSQEVSAPAQIPAGNLATGTEAKLAMAAAMIESNTTSRENPNDLYEVLYHGKGSDGMVNVTVQKFFSPDGTARKQLLSSNDYRVLNGQVFKVATDMIANSIVPSEVENLIPGVAKETQATGSATAIYQDYLIVGRTLRDQTKCKVEVKIFKNNAFVTTRQVDGCKP